MQGIINGMKKFISRLFTVFGIIMLIPILITGFFWLDDKLIGAFSPTIEYNKVITTGDNDELSYQISEMEEVAGYIALPVTYTNNFKDKEQDISADLFHEIQVFKYEYRNIAIRNKETGEINKLNKEYPSKDFERAVKEVNNLIIASSVTLNAGQTRTLYYPLARIIDMSVDTILDIKEQGFDQNIYEIIYMDEKAGEYKLLKVK